MARPRGVTTTAIVEVLLGIFALIGGAVHLLFGVGGLVSFSGSDVSLGAFAEGLGDIFTVEGAILVVAAIGLWGMKGWGWKLSVGVVITGIITSIPVLLLGSVGAAPALLVNFALLYYLLRQPTRALFRSPPTS